MGGRTKQLDAKARALRIKENRLRRQAGLLAGGNEILAQVEKRGERTGFEAGRQAGLRQALELCKEHRRMTHYVIELRKLVPDE